MRHVIVMTAATSAGLMSIFAVDLLSLLYISWLGDPKLTAAVGFASQVLFFSVSINIGISIAIGALVSRAHGKGDSAGARRLAASGLVHVFLIAALVSCIAWPFRREILSLIGARGMALDVASTYLAITLPATVLLGLGMALASILRAVGDARRSMYVTLAGAVATALLDPVFIFGLGLGVTGAAIVTLISRFVFVAVGLNGAIRMHDLIATPDRKAASLDLVPIMAIAIPAVLTNLAAPVANAYTMRIFSQFGEAVVAAFAILDRLNPMAFGVLFALSSAVGPIMGQNSRREADLAGAPGAHGLLDLRHALCRGGRNSSALGSAFDCPTLSRARRDGRAFNFCLRLRRSALAFPWGDFRRQRRLQQSRVPASLDAVQLGTRHTWHAALRDDRHRALWTGRRLCWAHPRLGSLWSGCRDHGLLRHGEARKTPQGLVASEGFAGHLSGRPASRAMCGGLLCSIFTRFCVMPRAAKPSIIWRHNSTSRPKRQTRRSKPSCRLCPKDSSKQT